jgi:hypothetical protein
LIDGVPAVKRLKESVQVDWFLEADHNSESWGEFFHRTFGMSEGPVVMTGHLSDVQQQLENKTEKKPQKHFETIHYQIKKQCWHKWWTLNSLRLYFPLTDFWSKKKYFKVSVLNNAQVTITTFWSELKFRDVFETFISFIPFWIKHSFTVL